jgi:hypothetical protein
MVVPHGRWILTLTAFALILAAGCSGPRKGEESTRLAPRTGNVEVTLLSFGSVQGELLECG